MQIINTSIADKFCGLINFLKQYRNTFETVADEVEDCNLRTALQGLSIESFQYANEITAQLKQLGIPYRMDTEIAEYCNEIEEAPATNIPGKGNELLSICTSSEKRIINAYNEILNEYLPMATLRNIMVYQLNALQFAFMKIKMLNNARFTTV